MSQQREVEKTENSKFSDFSSALLKLWFYGTCKNQGKRFCVTLFSIAIVKLIYIHYIVHTIIISAVYLIYMLVIGGDVSTLEYIIYTAMVGKIYRSVLLHQLRVYINKLFCDYISEF